MGRRIELTVAFSPQESFSLDGTRATKRGPRLGPNDPGTTTTTQWADLTPKERREWSRVLRAAGLGEVVPGRRK